MANDDVSEVDIYARVRILEGDLKSLKEDVYGNGKTGLKGQFTIVWEDLYGNDVRGIEGLMKTVMRFRTFIDKNQFNLALMGVIMSNLAGIAALVTAIAVVLKKSP